jgi:hypothetical protein
VLVAAEPLARIFFDVDETLLTWNWRVRPLAMEVFAELAASGFALYVWSGRGRRWDFVDVSGLRPYVTDCFEKPIYRHRERLAELHVPYVPDYVIDDDAEIVACFGGWHIPEPLEPLREDRHLLSVLHDIQDRFGLERGFVLSGFTPLESGAPGAPEMR